MRKWSQLPEESERERIDDKHEYSTCTKVGLIGYNEVVDNVFTTNTIELEIIIIRKFLNDNYLKTNKFVYYIIFF